MTSERTVLGEMKTALIQRQPGRLVPKDTLDKWKFVPKDVAFADTSSVKTLR